MSSAPLGQEETTLPRGFPSAYRQWLTAEFPEEVAASGQAICDLHGGDESRQYQSFLTCRTRAWFLRHKETGKLTVVSNSCRVRGCPFCARARGIQIAHRLGPWVRTLDGPKHMSLTIRHSDEPLVDQIDHLYKSFQKLRRFARWRRYVAGGLWFAQVTLSKKKQHWHPHLHCLLDSDYYPREQLSRDWAKATANSHNVFIRRIQDTAKAVGDASRYVARPGWLHSLPPHRRFELLAAFSGRRLCGAWGSARAADLLRVERLDPADWERVGCFSDVVSLARTDPHAAALLNAWLNGQTHDVEIGLQDLLAWDRFRIPTHTRDPPQPVLNLTSGTGSFWRDSPTIKIHLEDDESNSAGRRAPAMERTPLTYGGPSYAQAT